ncbi:MULTISPECIES: hypothetical protein [unclassified Streptomyces]
MPRIPARVVLASFALGAVTVTGCAAGHTAGTPKASARPSSSPPHRPPPTAAPASGPLTDAQARSALVTENDLGDPWAPTQGAATWRDGMLKATADAPDCRRLLDALYTDELFGAKARTRAVVGLDDTMDEVQLRYQVLALERSEVDGTLAWLKSLPSKCGHFSAKGEGKGAGEDSVRAVDVAAVALPGVGDAREGLRVTVTGPAGEGNAPVLTLDLAAVRVGDDTLAATVGSLGDLAPDVANGVVQLGTQRLLDVRKQGRAAV